MTILVIAEHDNTSLSPATLNAISAASVISTFEDGAVEVLVAGHNAAAVAEQLTSVAGVSKVLYADAGHLENGLAENVESAVLEVLRNPTRQYSHLVVAATAYGKSIAPRVAAQLDVAQVSDVIAVLGADTFERPIYAGNAIATVQSVDTMKVVTVRTTAFPLASIGGGATVESVSPGHDAGVSRYVGRELTKSERPELTAAQIVVSGGRGLGSGENYEGVLAPLADKLGAALGASRAAVDAGFAPNNYQVGQTGKIVAPQLYVAVGISGAIQHLAGMKDSKVIVAINKDPEAPIFSVADLGIEGDLFEVVPALVKALD
ncbi:FAD-binding protein [Paraburkholderia sp. CNPSo 3272]|uniref:electron transfer flavoprotein subunit alpha/FixB family protein n=1 Tax=Paraburkholderia sp. CNPSo 3272 TaxID=2940931 RepID=UPI0020B7E075|nr:FAD-binding protein [Paraburkholderia sp. CNPSo 3272]MCP3727096.1 FAD-binding protein [Paraburkholderia sp. CNPSo 3272]